MGIDPGDYINPKALNRLPERCYEGLLAAIVASLDVPPKIHKRSWNDTFSCFALLAQSTIGGFCSRKLQLVLGNLTWQDVEHIPYMPIDEPAWLGIPQKRITYPIYIAPPVRYALLLLVQTVMAQKPTRNGALRKLTPNQLLAPPDERLSRNQQAYLTARAREARLGFIPTLKDFRATGRWLLARVYPLDVLHAQLGLVPATAPLISQIQKYGPLSLLQQLRGLQRNKS